MTRTSLLLATVAGLAFAQTAIAADLPAKAPAYKAPVAVFDWTGPYVGAYIGVAASRGRSLDPIGPQLGDGWLEHTGYGLAAGGTAGYNWQLNWGIFGQKLVVGVEGDIGYFDTSNKVVDWNDPGLTYNTETSWLATVRARAGLTDGPNLTYVTGGYAALNFKDSNIDTATGLDVSSSQTKSGYALGSGVETMLGGGWTAKSEYLFVDVGEGDTLFNPNSVFTIQADRHRYHSQRFGVNYLFGAGKNGPLPQTNWGGLYGGIVGGGALASVRGTGLDGTPANAGEYGNNGSGISVGGQVGYNWMLAPRVVVGFEGDWSYLGINHDSVNFFNSEMTFNVDTSWIATARGRIGYSTGPALIYATGGGAWVNLTESFTDTQFSGAASSSKTLSGWTVGGGIETTLWGNWSTKSEYLYVDVGDGDTLTHPTTGYALTADHKFHLFRSALVYRFAGGLFP
jgi:outer membrane immunogenic protein